MKLKFDPSLQYQLDAISAVVDVFDGQPPVQAHFEVGGGGTGPGFVQSEFGVGNNLVVQDEDILANVHDIQERNDIPKSEAVTKDFTCEDHVGRPLRWLALKDGNEFSVEMETGTGKTYVYLRTIFELNKNYGFKKFIIVVPSVAVREGVLKSIEMTREHFSALYDKTPFNAFVYNSKDLSKVREFAGAHQLQIMIINIQAFQKDVEDGAKASKANIINREIDGMSGHKPIEFIQATNPFVIIDEPQSIDNTDKAKKAIARLNPVATLRYSATHRNAYNLLYKLDPVKAYDLELVKRIEVSSVLSDGDFNRAYIKLLKVDNRNGIKAQLEIHKASPNGPKPTKLWVKQNDNLFDKSGGLAHYDDGFIVQTIDCTPDAEYIEFNQGHFLQLGQDSGGLTDDIMKAQVFETVEQHLKKERQFKDQGIKVLSLFFIDRVANYRIYNEDGTTSLGKFGQWFEEAYAELTAKPIFKDVGITNIASVHDGYFSRDKKGVAKDTRGNTKLDDDTYALIMRDKERLLDPDVALRFIFSHSALREGWDNPNVFQICTLNETHSVEKKRQEIGRGLRLPVNTAGERVRDEHINRLTIIANVAYADFARTLQSEFEEDFNIHFGRINKIDFAKITKPDDETPIGQDASGQIWDNLITGGYLDDKGQILETFDPKNPHFELKVLESFSGLRPQIVDVIQSKLFSNRVVNSKDRKAVTYHKNVRLSPEFAELWNTIKQRTRYRVAYDTQLLMTKVIARIQDMPKIQATTLTITTAGIDIQDAGVGSDRILAHKSQNVGHIHVLPDILTYLQKETELTRTTLIDILKSCRRFSEFKINPQAFMASVAACIHKALHDIMIDGIQYEQIIGDEWDMTRIDDDAEKDLGHYLNRLYEVRHTQKALYSDIECDSEVEKQFAKDLDNNEHVKLFVKLPSWFKIETPIGNYNPDWAFMTERDEKLYFVRETKSTLDSDELRTKENQKIKCGKRHFETIGANFDVVTSLAEVGI
ncbi:MAG: DEAD/DEAH box helicase family protein [Magnetovibrio sp.]|nr:DEAD/DEAH box helicase family protein [Magnetovibrio sp.]